MRSLRFIFLGILSASAALLLELTASIFLSDEKAIVLSLSSLLIASAVIEEVIKFSIIFRTTEKFENCPINILNAVTIGLGFALTEIVLNVWKMGMPGAPLASYLGVVFVHSVTAFIAGWQISKGKPTLKKISFIIIFNILLHLGYNAAILNIN